MTQATLDQEQRGCIMQNRHMPIGKEEAIQLLNNPEKTIPSLPFRPKGLYLILILIPFLFIYFISPLILFFLNFLLLSLFLRWGCLHCGPS